MRDEFQTLHAKIEKAKQEIAKIEKACADDAWCSARRKNRGNRTCWIEANTTSKRDEVPARAARRLAADARRSTERPAGSGHVAGRSRASADRTRHRQSVLAAVVRRRAGEDGRRFRFAGRSAQSSESARLAGRPVHRRRLGCEEDDEADRDVGHLSADVARAGRNRIKRDPENRLLARGPRFRLDAEMLRDQALAVSGLLVDEMGGPSVKPPQPDGLWFAVGYSGSNTVRFKQDTGPEKVHRRTLYTFIKRTSPPPQLSTFDAPSREACCVRRERTNTPLQALLLMNDPQYVEAARALGERTMREGGGRPAGASGLDVPASYLPAAR